jgi:hypothetical protein
LIISGHVFLILKIGRPDKFLYNPNSFFGTGKGLLTDPAVTLFTDPIHAVQAVPIKHSNDTIPGKPLAQGIAALLSSSEILIKS